MTENERDELLIRLDERTQKIQKDLEDDYHALYGNGKPGLIEKVTKLEDWRDSVSRHYGAVVATAAFIINAAITVYALWKKAH